MDVAQILRELWRRRALVAVGVAVAVAVALPTVYRVSLIPPRLVSKTLTLNTAQTNILVDTPNSALTNLSSDLRPLVERANVFGRYATTLVVRRSIAEAARIPVEQLVVEAPFAQNQPRAAREPVAIQRNQQIVGEQTDYFVRFDTDSGYPVVRVFAQGPSVPDAQRLANAAATGLRRYVERVQDRRRVPSAQRIVVRQLGSAEGGTTGKNVKLTVTLVAFLATLTAWCLLVLLGANVAAGWRRLEAEERG